MSLAGKPEGEDPNRPLASARLAKVGASACRTLRQAPRLDPIDRLQFARTPYDGSKQPFSIACSSTKTGGSSRTRSDRRA